MNSFLLNNTLPKAFVTMLIVLALYYTVKCPCDKLLSCHYKIVLSLLGGAIGTIVLVNGPTIY